MAGNLSLAFPQSLTEKYRPRTVDEFCGLPKPKALARKLIEKPFPSAWLFVGPSGTGKTSLALAMFEQMRAEVHHIASKDCNLQTVEDVTRVCHYMPRAFENWEALRVHGILCDEADRMTPAAQVAWLSKLDATEPIPNTIVIFTCNTTDGLEPRFLSRCHVIEFSSYGIAGEVAAFLARVWDAETDNPIDRPNFARIVKENNNNVRGALMALETEILTQ